MDKQEVVTKVVQTVAQVQEMSGLVQRRHRCVHAPGAGRGGLRQPMRRGSDRHAFGVPGVDLPEDYNPFISKDGKRALSVGEIADNLSTLIGAEAIAR